MEPNFARSGLNDTNLFSTGHHMISSVVSGEIESYTMWHNRWPYVAECRLFTNFPLHLSQKNLPSRIVICLFFHYQISTTSLVRPVWSYQFKCYMLPTRSLILIFMSLCYVMFVCVSMCVCALVPVRTLEGEFRCLCVFESICMYINACLSFVSLCIDMHHLSSSLCVRAIFCVCMFMCMYLYTCFW